MAVKYRFNSLEDYLISRRLTVDAELDDGWGAKFPLKGRETEATILFSDISGFSRRTLKMTPTETLLFVNRFVCWVSAEAVRHSNGIVDKYIGDELMIVFSKEFGSADPFAEALTVARFMSQNDALDYNPHIGLASGLVTVGYTGTPIKYNCSVFGAAVAMAARCAAVKVPDNGESSYSTPIIFPSAEWGNRSFGELFPPERDILPDGRVEETPTTFKLLDPWPAPMKNMPDTEVRAVVRTTMRMLTFSVEDQNKRNLEALRRAGMYRPMPTK